MAGDELRFADLIAPFAEADFLARYHGKAPVHIRREGAVTAPLLGWDAFNSALATGRYWTAERLRLIMGSRFAMAQHYCDEKDTLEGKVMLANPGKVRAFLGMGASLVANQIEAVAPDVRRHARALQRRFGASVAANVYCSFGGVQAFETHYDLHDVFAVQTEGEKVWRIWEGRADTPIRGLPDGEATSRYLQATRGKLLFEAHMKPGDVLYLPRGQYHDALASTAASLHVTFSVSPLRGLDLIDLLAEEAEGESLFRAYIPDARSDREAVRTRLVQMAERVSELMQSQAFIDAVAARQAAFETPPDDYALPARPDPAYYAPTGEPAQLERRDSGHVVRTRAGEIPLGRAARAAGWILQQPFFTDIALGAAHPELGKDGADELIGQLLKAGIIAQTRPEGLPPRRA